LFWGGRGGGFFLGGGERFVGCFFFFFFFFFSGRGRVGGVFFFFVCARPLSPHKTRGKSKKPLGTPEQCAIPSSSLRLSSLPAGLTSTERGKGIAEQERGARRYCLSFFSDGGGRKRKVIFFRHAPRTAVGLFCFGWAPRERSSVRGRARPALSSSPASRGALLVQREKKGEEKAPRPRLRKQKGEEEEELFEGRGPAGRRLCALNQEEKGKSFKRGKPHAGEA